MTGAPGEGTGRVSLAMDVRSISRKFMRRRRSTNNGLVRVARITPRLAAQRDRGGAKSITRHGPYLATFPQPPRLHESGGNPCGSLQPRIPAPAFNAPELV